MPEFGRRRNCFNQWPLTNESWNRYGEILEKTIQMILSSKIYKDFVKRNREQEKFRLNRLKKEPK